MPATIDALHASTMTRARQTADIIAKSLKGLSPQLSRDIRECTPPTERKDIMKGEEAGAPEGCRQTLERAFARFFRPSPARDSTEVLVCHGNVIRYFVARALGLDPLRWLRMTIANCSLTVIRVRADGTMQLVSFGDMGHLPPGLQTFPGQRPATAPADSLRGR
jgi:serine/threonine-protein phosphatase PGAM5